MSIYARNARWLVVLGGLVALTAATTARACTTPVYRYAMYNWASSPYVVFYFHRGEPAEEDAEVNQVLAKLSREAPAANVVYEPVNLDAEDPLGGYPEPIKTAHEAHAEQEGPFHLVMTPWLAKLHAGRLNGNDVKVMVESPARTRMGELLDEGNAAILVLVPGKDDAENQRAREVVKQLIDQAGSGELLPGMLPEMGPPDSPMPPQAAEGDSSDESSDPAADDQSQPGAAGLQLAMLELSRSEPAETWLIRSLMAVEPDLEEYADEPMVFAVYGRGRAMPPYIGKGITEDLLVDVVAFLVGPCSCMVKEQNPGMDLLVRWDWEATADKMAANDPTMTGGLYDPYMYQELEVGEAEGQADEAETASDEALAELAAVTTDLEMPAEGDTPAEDVLAAPAVEPAQPESKPQPEADRVGAAESSSPSPAAVPAGAPSQDLSEGFTSRMLWRLGVGVVVGAIVVLGVGFVLIRKQG